MHDRYKYSILQICADLTGTARGSYSSLTTDQEFQERAEWLRYQLDHWEESSFPRCRAYDNAVYLLACAALDEWNDYRRKVHL